MPNAPDTPAIAIEGLRKSFGHNEVLKGIDLTVQPGEVIAIIGKSGSGKSTLLRCINGLETFEQGTLKVQGQPLAQPHHKRLQALLWGPHASAARGRAIQAALHVPEH
jgi:polar amino acid transport system ATP-binding protein